jgi:hypothetical protein
MEKSSKNLISLFGEMPARGLPKRVYYGLDLLLSKLSKAQSNGKFRERNNNDKILQLKILFFIF